ncbi:hypothetical protein DPMN_040401 [Dreissena polymorpha]|uniref:Uncharacterized protein n=1 Tax=Dreissena polymorpha TaxID=45954 RepID=A0A9D4CWU5_DREPO|nr:hypothetical protein DPMN_040401 [Dreissena polymorpha]
MWWTYQRTDGPTDRRTDRHFNANDDTGGDDDTDDDDDNGDDDYNLTESENSGDDIPFSKLSKRQSAKVLHSQHQREKPLRPWIISDKTGQVYGWGTHIAALLFAVDATIRIRDSKTD